MSSALGWRVIVFLSCYRPQTGGVCPSGRVSFFSSEKKETKEKRFKGCALKDPPYCTELLCSIKNDMFPAFAITGRASSCFAALRRASSHFARGNLYEAGTRTNCRGAHRSTAPTVSIAVKRDSDGRNPFSHYPRYSDLTSSALGWRVIVFLSCYRPQTGSVCPSGAFVFERKKKPKRKKI